MLTAAVNTLHTVRIDAVGTAVRAKSVAEPCQPTPRMHAHTPPVALILAHGALLVNAADGVLWQNRAPMLQKMFG